MKGASSDLIWGGSVGPDVAGAAAPVVGLAELAIGTSFRDRVFILLAEGTGAHGPAHPGVLRVIGRFVVLVDGLKKSKAGCKMPAVKSLHQTSDSKAKSEYIMGHSCEALALLVKVGKSFQAVPLTARFHEELVFSHRDCRTLLAKRLLLRARRLAAAGVGAIGGRFLLSLR